MTGFSKFFNNLRKRISKYGSKKIIEKAAIVAIVGVICLIAGSVLFEDQLKKNDKDNSTALTTAGQVQGVKGETSAEPSAAEAMRVTSGESRDETETSLGYILSKIKGAGKVDVMITYISGNEAVPAVDVKASESSTQEKDKEGGSRNIKENNRENSIVYEENQGVKKPFVVKEIMPKVKGVVIVADGAGDVEVAINLNKAAQALLDVAAHKIQVFQRSKN